MTYSSSSAMSLRLISTQISVETSSVKLPCVMINSPVFLSLMDTSLSTAVSFFERFSRNARYDGSDSLETLSRSYKANQDGVWPSVARYLVPV